MHEGVESIVPGRRVIEQVGERASIGHVVLYESCVVSRGRLVINGRVYAVKQEHSTPLAGGDHNRYQAVVVGQDCIHKLLALGGICIDRHRGVWKLLAAVVNARGPRGAGQWSVCVAQPVLLGLAVENIVVAVKLLG